MTTKDRVLTLLSACRGSYLSGEELAESLNLSRAAVWKAISALRAGGYPIEGQPSRYSHLCLKLYEYPCKTPI